MKELDEETMAKVVRDAHDWLMNIPKWRVLTIEEERSCYDRFKSGDLIAMAVLVESVMPLVVTKCLPFSHGYVKLNDLVNAAAMKIITMSMPKFDPAKGRLSTFIDLPIKYAILELMKEEEPLYIRDMLVQDDSEDSFIELFLPSEPEAGCHLDRKELGKVINRALDALPENHREIIEYRNGLNGRPRLTQPEIGMLRGVKKQAIQQAEALAMKSILHFLLDNYADLLMAHFPRLFAEDR